MFIHCIPPSRWKKVCGQHFERISVRQPCANSKFKIKDCSEKIIGDTLIWYYTDSAEEFFINRCLPCLFKCDSSEIWVFLPSCLQSEASITGWTIFCFMWSGCKGTLIHHLEISHLKIYTPQQVVSYLSDCQQLREGSLNSYIMSKMLRIFE